MSAGSLERLALLLGRAIRPLATALKTDPRAVLARAGLDVGGSVAGAAGVQTAIAALRSAIADLSTAIDSLNAAITVDDSGKISLSGAASLAKIAAVIQKLGTIGPALDGAAQADASLSPAEKLRIKQIAAELPRRLFDLAIIDAIATGNPDLTQWLTFVGLVDILPEPGDVGVPPKLSRSLRLDRIGDLIGHPLDLVKGVFGLGTPGFDGLELFARLKVLLDTRYRTTRILIEPGKPNAFELDGRLLVVDTAVNPPGLMLPLRLSSIADLEETYQIGDWQLKLGQKSRFTPESLLKISSAGGVSIVPAAGQATLAWSASFGTQRASMPFTLFAAPGGTIVSVANVTIGASISGSFDAASGAASAVPMFWVALEKGRVRLSIGGSDGFIRKILGELSIESTFDLGMDFSPDGGLRLRGGSGLEVQLASHFTLGPVSVRALSIGVGIEDGRFPIALTADLETSIGPLGATVQGIGIEIDLAVVAFDKGNLGPISLSTAFKPPKGIGVTMDAGGFKGGGFLSFDAAKGEYAGALELDFMGMFSVKAIGIINTKMPDGSPGFSLIILITAEFVPIQLSFGFTLNGVGGLFGLNRTIFVNALAEGIRTNAIKSILFPQDVIANVTRIISDIKQFFPPEQGHFVVGPMLKVGWGTPSIITLELGLLLDIPNPMFAIVGVLKAVLPTEDAPLLRLQVNFIGVVDFDRGYVFFRADLFDSRLLVFCITGSLAFLVSWGEQQTFALSVGGFHPDFRDIPTIPALPDGFRNMARIGISLLSDDNPRLKVESYFAVTSNTVQFGARVELYAAAAGFNVYGFLGYDVLFQFDPFRFVARLYGGIALRQDEDVIAGINITAQLSGPTPWDARGTATLTILFFDIDIDFHVTWGDPPPAIASETEDLLALLKREYADTRNWRAELPAENHLHVSLRTIEPVAGAAAPLVIHPAGVLTFSERVMPLEDYQIDKFGTRKPLNENHFKLFGANAHGLPIPADYQTVREQFATSQFSNLSDSEKLSRRSFARLSSGFRLTSTSNVQATLPVTREVVYELSYLRRKPIRTTFHGVVRLATRAYQRLVKGSAVRQSVLAQQQTRASLNAPPPATLREEQFVVASVAELTAYARTGESAARFATQAEAYQHQQALLREDPTLVGHIQVVSHFELAS